MKLYKVPNNTSITVNGEEFFFHHIDGMYSYCVKDGEVVHLGASTEVEICT